MRRRSRRRAAALARLRRRIDRYAELAPSAETRSPPIGAGGEPAERSGRSTRPAPAEPPPPPFAPGSAQRQHEPARGQDDRPRRPRETPAGPRESFPLARRAPT